MKTFLARNWFPVVMLVMAGIFMIWLARETRVNLKAERATPPTVCLKYQTDGGWNLTTR